MAVIKNLVVRAGADFSSLKKEMANATKTLNAFKATTSKTMNGIKNLLKIALSAVAIKSAVQDAMKVEGALQQISRIMGESTNQFLKWSDTVGASFGLSKSEALSYGAIFGNLVAAFSSDTQTLTANTQNLLQASAVVASSTGRTMDDVMQRIRSGLMGNTEAIEDLGIYAQVGMIKTTKAFEQFANGKSWDQLSYQTQQQIRLFSILEQVQTRYGTDVLDNTMTRQLQFVMQLKNIKLNIGQAFLPIYNFVLPALTRLASSLATVTSFIAQFMTALFGKATAMPTTALAETEAAVTSVGDAYTAAGKAAKASVSGFDEVNTLSQGSTGSENGTETTTASAPVASGINTESMLDAGSKASELAEKVRNAFDKMKEASSNAKLAINNTVTSIKEAVVTNKEPIIAGLTGITGAFGGFAALSGIPSIIAGIKTAITTLGAVIAGISLPVTLAVAAVAGLIAAFTYFYRTDENFKSFVDGTLVKMKESLADLWNNILVPLGEYIATGFVIAWNSTKEALSNLWNNVLVPLGIFLVGGFTNAWTGISNVLSWINKNVFKPVGDFLLFLWKQVLVPLGGIVWDVLGILFQNAGNVIGSFYNNVIKPLANFFISNFSPAVSAVKAVLEALWLYAIVPLANAFSVILKDALTVAAFAIGVITKNAVFLWDFVFKPLATFIGSAFSNAFDTAFTFIGGLIDGFSTSMQGILDFITGIFTGDWKLAWQGVQDIFAGIFEGLYAFVKAPLNLIIGAINSVIDGLNSISIDIPDWVPAVGGETWGISIPKMTKLAKGGITNGPMTALIGDNVGGREVVSPLSDLQDMLVSAVGTALLQANQFGSAGGQDKPVILKINDREIARAIIPAMDKERSRVGYVAIQGG